MIPDLKIGSFYNVKYKINIEPVVKLWNYGVVPSFDGKIWRLHSGKNARVIFEISKEELRSK